MKKVLFLMFAGLMGCSQADAAIANYANYLRQGAQRGWQGVQQGWQGARQRVSNWWPTRSYSGVPQVVRPTAPVVMSRFGQSALRQPLMRTNVNQFTQVPGRFMSTGGRQFGTQAQNQGYLAKLLAGLGLGVGAAGVAMSEKSPNVVYAEEDNETGFSSMIAKNVFEAAINKAIKGVPGIDSLNEEQAINEVVKKIDPKEAIKKGLLESLVYTLDAIHFNRKASAQAGHPGATYGLIMEYKNQENLWLIIKKLLEESDLAKDVLMNEYHALREKYSRREMRYGSNLDTPLIDFLEKIRGSIGLTN